MSDGIKITLTKDGKIVAKFNSITEVARYLKVSKSYVSQATLNDWNIKGYSLIRDEAKWNTIPNRQCKIQDKSKAREYKLFSIRENRVIKISTSLEDFMPIVDIYSSYRIKDMAQSRREVNGYKIISS